MNELNPENSAIETKLAAARTKLILDKPFLGALVLRLPMIAASPEWCKTTATDARAFYYNPDFIDSLDMSQTQFILAHEALHCALSHFHRRAHRIKHRWDVACDFAINPLLIDDGLRPPPEAPVFDEYRGMTAEEIYPLLDDNDQSETLDQHLYDDENQDQPNQNDKKSPPQSQSDQKGDSGQDNQGDKQDETTPPDDTDEQNTGKGKQKDGDSGKGSGHSEQEKQQMAGQGKSDKNSQQTGQQGDPGPNSKTEGAGKPPPLTPQEKENLSVQWQQRMAGAAQQAIQAGKFGGDMARMIDHMLQPRLPWRMLLADFMTSAARDDFSYMRPSRREGDAILPSLRSSQIDLTIAVDTSGSIRDEEIDEFIAEIDSLKAQLRARIQLIACDSKIADGAPWTFESWDELRMPEDLKGGGGTSFVPVFDWASQQDKLPDLLVYFTDAEGEFPEYEPDFPVIWLVKGKHKTPWGRRIQLN